MLSQETESFGYHPRGELEAEEIINRAFEKRTRLERFMTRLSGIRQRMVSIFPESPDPTMMLGDVKVFIILGGFSHNGYICIPPKENNYG